MGALEETDRGLYWTDFPMPLLCTPFEPGHIEEAVESIADPDRRAIARAEMCYFTARHEQACEAAEIYLRSHDFGLRLSALLIYGFASLALDRPQVAKKCMEALIEIKDEPLLTTCRQARASFVLVAAMGSILLHIPVPLEEEVQYRSIRALPEGLRMFACYVTAHRAYLRGEYGRCVGDAEGVFAVRQGSHPICELYLALVATMGWISLKDAEHADKWLKFAWGLAQPDDLIEGLAEHHGLLQGMLERCLREDYPDDLARILKVTCAFSHGWRALHNHETGGSVTDRLTTTEFAIAMLACREWNNEQIAEYIGLSRGTVKNRLSNVYSKLGITSRAELRSFMLR